MLVVTEGDQVEAGQTIATLGTRPRREAALKRRSADSTSPALAWNKSAKGPSPTTSGLKNRSCDGSSSTSITPLRTTSGSRPLQTRRRHQ